MDNKKKNNNNNNMASAMVRPLVNVGVQYMCKPIDARFVPDVTSTEMPLNPLLGSCSTAGGPAGAARKVH